MQAVFEKFIQATAEGKEFRRLTGADRLAIYCTSARTGLRANELGSLTPESFELDAKPPTVTVQAGYSKHRRQDVVPLHASLVELLRGYLEGEKAKEPIWPGTWTEAAAEMVRVDLEAAGIPYKDDRGRVFDFHALRHTFITHLARAGIHVKVAQTLARHSTITLTMDTYTHLGIVDVIADLDKLPGFNLPNERKNDQSEAG